VEWSKAKNILIIIFVILNVFLLVYSGIYREKTNVSKEEVVTAINILKKNGVIIDPACEIPTYKKNTSMLVFENGNINKQKIIDKLFGKNYVELKQLDEKKTITEGEKSLTFAEGCAFTYNNTNPSDNINISQEKGIERYLRDYLADMGINMSRYILDKYTKNKDNTVTLIFIEKYKNFLIYDNKISISIAKNGITNITLNIKKIKGFTKAPSPIMPAHQVLLKSFYNKKGVTIKFIDIGFKGFENEDNGQETKEIFQGPAWRITAADGREVFLKAYDGEEIN